MIRMTARLIDDTGRFEKKLYNKSERFTEDVAQWFVERVRGAWSDESPSPQGGPPGVVTGELNRSIRADRRDDLGRFTAPETATRWSIRAGADYAEALDLAVYDPPMAYNRPFFTPAVEDLENVFDVEAERMLRL